MWYSSGLAELRACPGPTHLLLKSPKALPLNAVDSRTLGELSSLLIMEGQRPSEDKENQGQETDGGRNARLTVAPPGFEAVLSPVTFALPAVPGPLCCLGAGFSW